MFEKFFRFLVAALALFSVVGCVVTPTAQVPPNFIGQMPPGYTATIEGHAGSNAVIGPKFRVPHYCAGRLVNLSAEYRTSQLYGATRVYHGIHFDYELVAPGSDPWPADWQASPSPEWQRITRQWFMPSNMGSAWIRVGPQGVGGTVWVRNLLIVC